MKVELMRHATVKLHLNGKKLLIDPVLGDKGTMSAIKLVPDQRNNPLVDLPVSLDSIIDCDAVLVTHTHRDHFDEKAMEVLPKSIPLFCQPEDEAKIKANGFTNVTAVIETCKWNGISLIRTKGKHGHGATALLMAPVSGFITAAPDEPSVYLMGDTIWCSCTKKAMQEYKPEIVICNCGEARLPKGKPITMGASDILQVCSTSPDAKVVAVHMEAWNHCRLSRKALHDFVETHSLNQQVFIPADGEVVEFQR